MAKGSWWKDLLGALGPAAGAAAGSLRDVARETMQDAQDRIRETTRMVVKAAVVFIIIALGFIYVLNGFGKWLEVTNGWTPGIGPMLIGGVIVALGLFAVAIRR